MNKIKRLFVINKWILRQPLNKGCKPKAIARFWLWQVNSRLNNYSIIMPWVNNTQLIVKKGLSSTTGNLYAGLQDFKDMSFLLHFLRREDTFVDIGANIGSYSILASGAVGACSIAIEPIPETWSCMQANIVVNGVQKLIDPLNVGLGSECSTLRFTHEQDITINHVAMDDDKEYVNILVRTLDDVIEERTSPSLIKIDVEGFETEVLKGGKNTLADESLKAIIIELNGSGSRYGFKDEDIHTLLLNAGFSPYDYDPFTRRLTALATYSNTINTIYIRDIEFVQDRINMAEKFKILEKEI